MRLVPHEQTPTSGDGPPPELETFHPADWIEDDEDEVLALARARRRWLEARRAWEAGAGVDVAGEERRAVVAALAELGYERDGLGWAYHRGYPIHWDIVWNGSRATATPAKIDRPPSGR